MDNEVLTRNGLDGADMGYARRVSDDAKPVLEVVARLLDEAASPLKARDNPPHLICDEALTKLDDARAILAEVLK